MHKLLTRYVWWDHRFRPQADDRASRMRTFKNDGQWQPLSVSLHRAGTSRLLAASSRGLGASLRGWASRDSKSRDCASARSRWMRVADAEMCPLYRLPATSWRRARARCGRCLPASPLSAYPWPCIRLFVSVVGRQAVDRGTASARNTCRTTPSDCISASSGLMTLIGRPQSGFGHFVRTSAASTDVGARCGARRYCSVPNFKVHLSAGQSS